MNSIDKANASINGGPLAPNIQGVVTFLDAPRGTMISAKLSVFLPTNQQRRKKHP